MMVQFIAVLSCTLFAGAALYINVAEHPARLACGTELAATVFGASYRRAAPMQVFLVLIATMTASLVTNTGRAAWFVGVLVLLVYAIFAMTLYLLPPKVQ